MIKGWKERYLVDRYQCVECDTEFETAIPVEIKEPKYYTLFKDESGDTLPF